MCRPISTVSDNALATCHANLAVTRRNRALFALLAFSADAATPKPEPRANMAAASRAGIRWLGSRPKQKTRSSPVGRPALQ